MLLLFSFQKNEWKKFRAPKGVGTPKGRRSHTATVFQVAKIDDFLISLWFMLSNL